MVSSILESKDKWSTLELRIDDFIDYVRIKFIIIIIIN